MAVEYEFLPDQRINEVLLAQKLQVSRTPIREALNRLVNEGLITLERNRGFFCRPLDIDQTYHLFELRGGLERMSVALASERGTDKNFKELAAFWQKVEARAGTLDLRKIALYDEEFHERIADAAKNPELLATLRGVNIRLRFARRFVIAIRDRDGVFSEHRAIAEALASRDKARAETLMADHVRLSRDDAVSVIKQSLAKIYMPHVS